MITFYIVCIGIQISFLYSLLGPFIALLKNAFMIDAIGHSIVFGISLGFLISHSLKSPIIFIAAILSAFLMNIINDFLQKNKIGSQDASLGIAFSTLFSLGILLISLYAKNIHLDLDMILLGNIEYTIYDAFLILPGLFIPKIIIFLFLAILFFIIFLYYSYDQIHMVLFDKEFSKIRGINIKLINYILITSVTIIIILTFNAMGSLLLLGITVAPFGLSWHNSNSYKLFLKKGIIYCCITGMIGVLISLKANISISASITFCITTVALVKHFIEKYKLKL